MKTLFEKMRDNRSKAVRVKTAKWLEEAKAKAEEQEKRHRKQAALDEMRYEAQKEALRGAYNSQNAYNPFYTFF